MLKKVLAVCDTEEAYTGAFIDFLRSQKNPGFHYLGFSNIKSLLEYAASSEPFILLISETLITDEVRNLKLKMLCLVENKEDVDENSVYKYQKISDIVTEISVKCNSDFIKRRGKNLLFGESRLIGIYSPVKRTGKSVFGISLAGILARKYRVLYINLETSCGFEWAFFDDDSGDISDIIYDIRQGKTDIELKLSEIIKNNGYFDFLPPAVAAEDVRAIEYDQLLKLFDFITVMNRYHIVILDFDELLDEYLTVISDCEKLFMPLIDDDISISKLRRFLKVLDNRCIAFDKERMIPLALPKCDEDIVSLSGMDRLLWSNFGVYVKEVIQEVNL